MKKYIVLVFILLFIGCGKNEPTKETILPSWYLNAPQNNQLYLYGEGNGYTLDEAKINALNAMASKLIVSISSSLTTQTNTFTNGIASSYDKTVSNKVTQDVEKIEFTNAKTKEAKQINNQFFVLMQVNAEELFNIKHKEFLNLDTRIKELYIKANTKNNFEKIFALNEILELSNSASKKAKILNAINNDFNAQPYISKYNNYLDIQNELKYTTPIQIVSNEKSDYFKNTLNDVLSSNRYKVSSNASVLIELSINTQYSQSMGWDIVKANTNIILKENGKTLSSYTITSLGRSSTSKETALSNAALDFKKQIELKGLENILFAK